MRTEVVTLAADDHLDVAGDLMSLKRIRHLPVLAEDRLVGIVSQRDLYRAGMSSVLELGDGSNRDWLRKVAVRDTMTTSLVTIGPDEEVRTAIRLLLEKKVGCLPVVEGEALVGLLSETDCLFYLEHLLEMSEQRQRLPEWKEG